MMSFMTINNFKKNNKNLTDTSNEASAVYYNVLRKLGPKRRAEICFELSDNIRQMVEDGIRHRHPEYNHKMVKRELFRIMFGDSLFNQVFGQKKSE